MFCDSARRAPYVTGGYSRLCGKRTCARRDGLLFLLLLLRMAILFLLQVPVKYADPHLFARFTAESFLSTSSDVLLEGGSGTGKPVAVV